MGDEGLLGDYALTMWRPVSRAQPRLVLLAALFTALISAAVCVGRLGGPERARRAPSDRAGKALRNLRRSLAELPETEQRVRLLNPLSGPTPSASAARSSVT